MKTYHKLHLSMILYWFKLGKNTTVKISSRKNHSGKKAGGKKLRYWEKTNWPDNPVHRHILLTNILITQINSQKAKWRRTQSQNNAQCQKSFVESQLAFGEPFAMQYKTTSVLLTLEIRYRNISAQWFSIIFYRKRSYSLNLLVFQ